MIADSDVPDDPPELRDRAHVLRDYVDARIARLVMMAEASGRQVELALAAAEKLETERIGALAARMDVADDERGKAAEVLRNDLRTTAVAAAEEREKSAAALRAGIEQQLASLKELLIALIDSRTEQARLTSEAATAAVEKAERANEQQFHAANEWRRQSADRERSQAQEMAKLTATFLRSDTAEAQLKGLRDSFEAQVGELRRMIEDIGAKVNSVV